MPSLAFVYKHIQIKNTIFQCNLTCYWPFMHQIHHCYVWLVFETKIADLQQQRDRKIMLYENFIIIHIIFHITWSLMPRTISYKFFFGSSLTIAPKRPKKCPSSFFLSKFSAVKAVKLSCSFMYILWQHYWCKLLLNGTIRITSGRSSKLYQWNKCKMNWP